MFVQRAGHPPRVVFHLLECVLPPCQEVCLQTEKGVSVSVVIFHLLEGVLPQRLSANRKGNQCQCCNLSPARRCTASPSGSPSANKKGSQCQPPHQEVHLQTKKGVSVSVVIFHLLEGVLHPHQEVCKQKRVSVSVL